MNIQKISILSLFCLMGGGIFFCYQKELIIFRFKQSNLDHNLPLGDQHTYTKEVTCHFWHNNNWHEEKKICLWSDIKEINLKQIVSIWLTILEQESTLPTKITAQTVALNPTGYSAFISFDQNPLPQNGPLYHKIMWIEGLLKTIKNNGIMIQSIYFLHNHQPLVDPHLVFSQPWPLNGFLNT